MILPLARVPHHRSERLLKAVSWKKGTCVPKVRPSLTSRRLHRVLTLRCTGAESYKHVATIGTLSDAVLLVIFDFYQKDPSNIWEYYWHRLAHVCHRWREIVFASPVRLHIEILCSFSTSVKKILDIWPAFPITINYPLCLPHDAESSHSSTSIACAKSALL